jgi:hypothetical protein
MVKKKFPSKKMSKKVKPKDAQFIIHDCMQNLDTPIFVKDEADLKLRLQKFIEEDMANGNDPKEMLADLSVLKVAGLVDVDFSTSVDVEIMP